MTERKKARLRSVLILIFFLAIMLVPILIFGKQLRELGNNPDQIEAMVKQLGFFGRAVIVFFAALQVIIAVIPGQPFEFAGGFCFGVFEGTLLTLGGILLGSTIAFFLARKFGLKAVSAFCDKDKLQNMAFLKTNERQKFLTFIAFLIPGIPKDLISYFLGLTKMRYTSFIIISAFGRLPGILLATIGGSAIQMQSGVMFLIFGVMLLVFAGVGIVFYIIKSRKEKATLAAANSAENAASTPQSEAEPETSATAESPVAPKESEPPKTETVSEHSLPDAGMSAPTKQDAS